MGIDSGLEGGSAVVDTNAKVYGTDNLFVVDSSIFPGMVSTNPSALIVAAAEHASLLILNHGTGDGSSPPTSDGGSGQVAAVSDIISILDLGSHVSCL